jgi:hypothetical protein
MNCKSERIPRSLPYGPEAAGLASESENGFLRVEDSLQLAAGSFNDSIPDISDALSSFTPRKPSPSMLALPHFELPLYHPPIEEHH